MLFDIRPPKLNPINRRDDVVSTYDFSKNTPDVNDEGKKIVLKVTKSSLGQFGFCEQQYFLKYRLGIKEPQNDDMLRGTNVHDAYEYFLDRGFDINKAWALKDNEGYEGVNNYFQSLIPESQISKGWDDEYAKPTGNPYTLGEREHLSRLMKAEAARFMGSEAGHFKPLGNEITIDALVDFYINGESVTVHLQGIIDRLFIDPNGVTHVHELKTGKWMDKESKLENMRKEMAFYVYLLRKSDDPLYGGMNVKYWGWDHTAGFFSDKNQAHPDQEQIYRFVEEVRTESIQHMLTDLKALISAHLQSDGTGNYYAVKPYGAEKYICEPFCRMRGYCSKYNRHLMPHDLKDKIGWKQGR